MANKMLIGAGLASLLFFTGCKSTDRDNNIMASIKQPFLDISIERIECRDCNDEALLTFTNYDGETTEYYLYDFSDLNDQDYGISSFRVISNRFVNHSQIFDEKFFEGHPLDQEYRQEYYQKTLSSVRDILESLKGNYPSNERSIVWPDNRVMRM